MKNNLKKLISTVAALAISASCFTAFAANFSDVADTASYKTAVDNIVALGIAQGNPDGTFAPENLIKRSEVAKMIVGTMGPAMMSAAESSKGATGFADVAADHWASGFIKQGVSKGFINGMGDGTFAPDENVTFGQVVKMLVCVLGYGSDAEAEGGWVGGGYLSKGSSLGITEGLGDLDSTVAVNRGQVAELINNSLDIPVKAVTGYETGFEMTEEGLKTVQVPVMEVMDGKKDRDYETLLTTYFDAYAVRGRIMSTADKAEGVVQYQIEYSKNFDDVAYDMSKNKTDYTTINDAIYPAGVDVDALLCAYTDAIVMENEDGDWELISIASFGKNDVYELSSELYANKVDPDTTKNPKVAGVIEFYKNADTTKTDEYDLDDNVQYYVNGVKGSSADIDTYVKGSATTTVTLVDTPANGSTSIDGDIDYVMLTVWTSAVVTEVEVDEEEATIYLSNINNKILADSYIELDLEAVADGEATYSLVDTEGNEVAIDALQKNDVISIYANVKAANVTVQPDYIDMVVCKNVVNGTVSQNDSEDNEYLVDGEWYGFAHSTATLEVGTGYDLYLDMFGKIVKWSQSATYANYGIVNRVAENNSGDPSMRLVTADGEVVSYIFKDTTEYNTWNTWYTTNKSKSLSDALKAGALVTYKVNASDKIYDITSLTGSDLTIMSTADTFSENSLKIGSAKMNELTKVVNYANVYANKVAWSAGLSGYVSAASVTDFVDDEDYIVAYVTKKSLEIDNKYTPFVVVLKGTDGISAASSLAIVESTGESINEADGMKYTSATVYENGSKDPVTVYFDFTPSLKKGDIIVYTLNSEGLVATAADYNVLFNAEESVKFADVNGKPEYATGAEYLTDLDEAKYLTKYTEKDSDGKDVAKYSIPSIWADANKQGDKTASVGFGYVIDNNETELTVGKLSKNGDKYWTAKADIEEVDYASEVNVYVYDQGAAKDKKIKLGSVSSVRATFLPETAYADDNWNWQHKDANKVAANAVFYKTFEGEITDIILITPASDK